MSTAPARSNRSKPQLPAAHAVPACPVILAERDLVVPPSAHTLAGFRAWATSDAFPERGRISFLDQEIVVDMSPEEIETHAKVKAEITYAIVALNKKLKLGEFYPDGVLLTNVDANLSTEADSAFATWETLESGRVRLIPREGKQGQYIEMEGSPDWVLEIVSEHSVRKDTVRLRERYHRAGIGEYWLIDARAEEIEFTILLHGKGGYREAEGKKGWQTSPLFKRRFRLVRRRGRRNHWEYTLQVKPLG
jgi:Uma2 family endonuclease